MVQIAAEPSMRVEEAVALPAVLLFFRMQQA